MAIFTVTSLNDAGAGSLREAIALAEAQAGADVIVFDPGLAGGTIRLVSRLEFAADTVAVEGGGAITISGDSNGDGVANGGDAQLLRVGDAAAVTLSGLALTGGYGFAGAADPGTAIHNRGVLTIADSTISGNVALGFAFASGQRRDAATLYNDARAPGASGGAGDGATLTVTNTVFADNAALGGEGDGGGGTGGLAVSGILNTGNLTVGGLTFGGRAYGGYGADGAGPADDGGDGGAATVGILSLSGQVSAAGGATAIAVGADGATAAGGDPGAGLNDGARGAAAFGLVLGSGSTAGTFALDLSAATDAPVAGASLTGARVLLGSAAADAVAGGAGREVFFGAGGADTFVGVGPEDLVRMGAGADTVSGQGAVRLEAEAGDDLAIVSGAGDVTVEGGGGVDTLRFATPFGVDVSLLNDGARILVRAAAQAADRLFLTVNDIERLIGSESADTLTGGEANTALADNRLEGRGGADLLAGLGGADTLLGGSGDDTLTGGAGNDRLEGGAGLNRLQGGSGVDTAVFGDALADYTLSQAGGVVTVANGTETAVIDGVETFLFADGARSFAALFPGAPPVDPNPVDPNPVDPPGGGPTAGNDSLAGAAGSDRIDALAGDDRVSGLAGADTLIGGAGRDTLLGGGGRDRLEGGGGADRLEGGRGADFLTGGAGRDRFQFAAGDGQDRILDFRDGQDRIEFLTGVDEFADLTILQRGDDVLIRHLRGAVRVEDADADDLSAADFLFA